MGTYGNYQSNEALEKNGVQLDLGESGTFIVARAGGSNKKYQELVRKLSHRHRRAIIAGTIDSETADRITIEAFARTIVIGWLKEGDDGFRHPVTGPDGNPLPYSVENARKLLTDLPDLFSDIKDCAEGAAAYRAEVTVEEGEPLPESSDTP